MRRVAARGRSAVSLLRTVASRDLRKVLTRRADQQVVAGRRENEVVVDVGGRRLPARVAPYRTPMEHRADLVRRVLDAMDAAGLTSFTIPDRAGAPRVVAVAGAAAADVVRAVGKIAPSEGLFVSFPEQDVPAEQERLCRPHEVASFEGPVLRLADLATGEARTTEGPSSRFSYGLDLAIDLELWTVADDGAWVAPRRNAFVEELPASEQRMAIKETSVGRFRSIEAFCVPSVTDVTFPIDVVYTWVDGTDTTWQRARAEALGVADPAAFTENAASDARFLDHDELRYSLRSLEKYAPWVNHIWIVTAGQVPAWLNVEHPKVTVVDHRDIWSPEGTLPTFNSHAIEAHLHRIEGLSEHFLYFNDDVFLGRPCDPELFFEANGLEHIFLSAAKVAEGPATPGEIASDTAGKNARRLVEEVTGRRIRRKFFHAPYALRRDVSYELEERFRDVVVQTAQSVFRRSTDVTMAGALHAYYALATGRGVQGRIRYRYINIASGNVADHFQQMTRAPYDVFCLNDVAAEGAQPREAVDAQVRSMLACYFPHVSSFEVAARVTRAGRSAPPERTWK